MGTRGFIGIVIDGDTKISFNNFDSYPDGLGVDVLRWVRDNARALASGYALRDAPNGPVGLARKLQIVSGESAPTPAQVKHLKRYADLGVSEQSLTNWYCLLRKCQGDIGATLDAGVIVDSSDFPADSLFAEWGYVVDMDDPSGACLEAYQGFQSAPHTLGRFHALPVIERTTPYYPVALRAAWSLNALPSDAEFFAMLADGDK